MSKIVRVIKSLYTTAREIYAREYALKTALDIGLVKFGISSYGRPEVYYWDTDTSVIVGNYCSIARGVRFILGGEHGVNYTSTFPFTEFLEKNRNENHSPEIQIQESFNQLPKHPLSKGDIIIGNDVWIGFGATVLSGVRVGNGAIIGAGAVVSSNVPDYAIVAGNPARIIRYRFGEEEISKLNQIQWWNWPETKVWDHFRLLMSEPANFFLAAEKLNL